ncbi:TetR family transcriptional regulator [Streptomyces sp. Amel2xB2]|uniref:TetR/AcrR family transcriptional regulator n=1 Tax=Streptomyces sp. Amel2xB2 TaxID=1305829 RepID=UPI000DBF4143|nr:TetR/AcrR family transcriptional regulator [Streptomyces sp. Amel2xB2]RAJ69018.1 TetR family transcriptional regulator [Streptomyces sp. Amel2xB2]
MADMAKTGTGATGATEETAREGREGSRPGKAAYHHGDLRNALIDAATDLAREGGPESVVLRAAARRVGVSPTAAYRHFAGQAELLRAVKELGQEHLARAMEAGRSTDAPGPEAAEARLRALGHGYLSFALAEPGLYRAAFCRDNLQLSALDGSVTPDGADGTWEFRSFGILVEALDGLVEHGRMPAEQRTGAELTAWSTVHGLAMLFLDGPLAALSSEEIHAVAERAFDVLIAGFAASPARD